MVKITKKRFINAIDNTGGILTAVAAKLNVSRTGLYFFLKKEENSWAQEYLMQEREKIIDLGENSLFQKVKSQEAWATKFLLSTLGKSRGYVEKQEVEHQGGLNIKGYDSVSPDDWDDEEKKEEDGGNIEKNK